MADLYTKTSSGVERIDVSVPKIEERVTNLENNKLGKTEKAASALVADSANSIEGANVKGTVANATNAVNAANATTATSATSASSVPWTGITGKPSFATVATSGSYNDLKDKPEVSSLGTFKKILEQLYTSEGKKALTITNAVPNKILYVRGTSPLKAPGMWRASVFSFSIGDGFFDASYTPNTGYNADTKTYSSGRIAQGGNPNYSISPAFYYFVPRLDTCVLYVNINKQSDFHNGMAPVLIEVYQ